MIIYKDLVSGDELISDSYDLKDVEDVVYEVDGKLIQKGGDDNFDIGANPSAEEADEGVESSSSQVIDIVESFRLNKLEGVFNTKKDYTGQLKTYLKKVVEAKKAQGDDEAAIKAFQTKVQGYFTKVIAPNFKDYEFFVGESMDTDGMLVLLNYRKDGVTPYFIIWKHGVSEMKV